jgi:hypothetical protein
MALYRSNSAVYAIIKESTFNTGGTFLSANVVEVTSDTAMKPEGDSIERKAIKNSFVSQPKMAGKIFGSGKCGVELIPLGGASKDLNGSALLEVALGIVEVPGLAAGGFIGFSDNGVTPAKQIYEAGATQTGLATLYKLAKPCGSQPSLSIKQFLGCNTSDSQTITYTGVVPSSVKFDFPVANVASITFDVGASGYSTASGEAILSGTVIVENPYIGKNATFTISGTAYEAKDLSFTIENTIVDREAITSSGITAKAITKKMIKGSLAVVFSDYSELTKFKNNTDAAIYLEMVSGTHKFAIWFPRARYTAVSIENADGILENKIEFEAYEDSVLGEAIYVAHQ